MSAIGTTISLAIPMTTPLLLACMGAIISERSGVLNLGIEGTMSVGALTGIIATATTGSPAMGFAIGVFIGTIFMSLLAILSVSFKADQVITGVMLSLLGVSLSTYFGAYWIGKNIKKFSKTEIPLIGGILRDIPIIGEVLFYNTPIDYAAVLLVPIFWYIVYHTNLGLEITAVGNDPETADTMGIDVIKTRYMSVLISGALASAGGAALALSFTGFWTTGMVNNRGWVAVALVIVSRWDPMKALFSTYFFGIIYTAQFRAQNIAYQEFMPFSDGLSSIYDVLFHSVMMSTYPFFFTIIALVFITFNSRHELGTPQALTEAYTRESK